MRFGHDVITDAMAADAPYVPGQGARGRVDTWRQWSRWKRVGFFLVCGNYMLTILLRACSAVVGTEESIRPWMFQTIFKKACQNMQGEKTGEFTDSNFCHNTVNKPKKRENGQQNGPSAGLILTARVRSSSFPLIRSRFSL